MHCLIQCTIPPSLDVILAKTFSITKVHIALGIAGFFDQHCMWRHIVYPSIGFWTHQKYCQLCQPLSDADHSYFSEAMAFILHSTQVSLIEILWSEFASKYSWEFSSQSWFTFALMRFEHYNFSYSLYLTCWCPLPGLGGGSDVHIVLNQDAEVTWNHKERMSLILPGLKHCLFSTAFNPWRL